MTDFPAFERPLVAAVAAFRFCPVPVIAGAAGLRTAIPGFAASSSRSGGTGLLKNLNPS
jgi:hypothetical protein